MEILKRRVFCDVLCFVAFCVVFFGLFWFGLLLFGEGPIIIYFSRQIPAVMIPFPFQKWGGNIPKKCNGWNLQNDGFPHSESPFQGLIFRFDF